MKEEIGIVDRYNGYAGRIKANDKEYILLDKDIINNENIKPNDEVNFIPEIKNDVYIARFVRKKEKKDNTKYK